jgi:hypothetical protein
MPKSRLTINTVAAPTVVKRRENLRSASFRDYTIEETARDNGARS